jgi:hypothetical protein
MRRRGGIKVLDGMVGGRLKICASSFCLRSLSFRLMLVYAFLSRLVIVEREYHLKLFLTISKDCYSTEDIKNVTPGEHILRCELLRETKDPSGGHDFRILAVHAL